MRRAPAHHHSVHSQRRCRVLVIEGQPVEHRLNEHNDSMYDPEASLARIDAIAAATLSSELLVRYEAYKQVLLARDRDHAAIAATLTLFVSDLSEANDRRAATLRSGNGT
jgi:hypothetical protein